MNVPRAIFVILTIAWVAAVSAFNGELAELECPDDCDCHYFRINWVTDCSDSNLTQIPYTELSMDVYILDMNSNRITHIDPFPVGIKLRRFQIADNLLTEVKKQSFEGLNFLIDADLSENRITTIEPDAFEDLPGFITLELQGNPLAPIDGPFVSSKRLIYLDISKCGLTYLNNHFFSNATALSTLDLSDNPLGSIENAVFKPLTSLEILKMNNCHLKRIGQDVFVSQETLKILEIAGNSLRTLDWGNFCKHLPRLEYLDVRNSEINHVPEDTFNNNHFLRTLILAENPLSQIDVVATIGQKLHELDTLDLSYCNLERPLSEDAFINATKLRVLNLSGNSLFSSDLLVALAPLVNLQKLSLSNCGFSRLPNTFHKFKSLQELDISHNPLNDVFIKLLTPLETLEYLNMGYSNLSYISPTTFSKMTSMKRLVLSGNDLLNLEAGLFGGLTRLESLELNHCGLRRPLNATLFFNNLTYTDLTELQLAGNPLQVSPLGPLLPKQFSRLKYLDLSNCNLTFLPPDAFYWTRNITHLILFGNRFTSSAGMHFLELLPGMEMLDLRYNNLTTFSPNDLQANHKLDKLKLVGNPWICDCNVAELWDWANIHKGNLGILEGSTLDAEHITAGKLKRKKLLVCNYDSSVQMPLMLNKTAAGRRPFSKPIRLLTSTNRTWAKYVRESGCEQKTPKLSRSARSVRAKSFEDELMESSPKIPNTWAIAAANAALVYLSIIAFLGIVYALTQKQRQHNTSVSNNFNKDN